MDKKCYVAPEMEVIEVEIENGFATSPGYDGFEEEKRLW